jgi:hypothetical protein
MAVLATIGFPSARSLSALRRPRMTPIRQVIHRLAMIRRRVWGNRRPHLTQRCRRIRPHPPPRRHRRRQAAVGQPIRAIPSLTNPGASPSTQRRPRPRTRPIRSCPLSQRRTRSTLTGRRSMDLRRLAKIQRRRITSIPTGRPWGQVLRRPRRPGLTRKSELRRTACHISRIRRDCSTRGRATRFRLSCLACRTTVARHISNGRLRPRKPPPDLDVRRFRRFA